MSMPTIVYSGYTDIQMTCAKLAATRRYFDVPFYFHWRGSAFAVLFCSVLFCSVLLEDTKNAIERIAKRRCPCILKVFALYRDRTLDFLPAILLILISLNGKRCNSHGSFHAAAKLGSKLRKLGIKWLICWMYVLHAFIFFVFLLLGRQYPVTPNYFKMMLARTRVRTLINNTNVTVHGSFIKRWTRITESDL
jgi:hypothetical protein